MSSFGGRNGEKLPAPAGDVLDTTVYRYAVKPPAAMLMIVPLMIWSALTEMLSHAWSERHEDSGTPPRSTNARRSAGVIPKNADASAGIIGARTDAGQPADERRGQHHPLDADVDDARPLAHHAAQRRERDRDGRLEDRRRVQRQDVDQVAGELEEQAQHRHRVQRRR